MPNLENDRREEARLLAAIASGDRAALRRLYTAYGPPLFSLAIRLLGDTGTAEEALQDTFVKIWQHAARYDARKSKPFTWAVTILRRTCIDQMRKQGRAPDVISLPDDVTLPTELSLPETIRQTVEGRETTELLQATLATIAQPRRTALELALFSSLTHHEIAERLSQPIGTVKTWIRRGLLELRQTLTAPTP